MEQLRTALEVLKKYHFWILCTLIVLVTFGVWFKATSDRSEAFKKAKSEIDGALASVGTISRTPDFPSEDYIQAIEYREDGNPEGKSDAAKKIANIPGPEASLSGNVNKGASRLYADQNTGLRLPPIYPNNAEDQASFEKAFWKVWNHKIEDIEKPPAEEAHSPQYELDKTYRLIYRDRIKDIFPELFKMIELRTTEANANGVAGGNDPRRGMRRLGNGGEQRAVDDQAKENSGVVDWPDYQQLARRNENWNDIPTTIAVMVAQEDLWVYEALLKVIRNTNDTGIDPKHDAKNYKPPTLHKDARVKEIQALEIGSDATQSWAASENSVFTFPADGGAPAGAQAGAAGPPPGGGFGRPGQAQYAQGANGAVSLLAGRYVDNSGKPVTDQTDPTKINQEFRMMPIDLKVVMEQKDIPRLLRECANSNMRIDVSSVRVLADKPPAFDPGGGATAPAEAAPATGPGPPRGARPDPRGGGEPGPPRGMAAYRRGHGQGLGNMGQTPSQGNGEYSYSDESADPTAPPVPVEIQGVIYIYNPPTARSPGGAATGAAPPTAPPPTAPPPTAPPPTVPPGAAAPTPAGPNKTPATGAH